MFVEMWIVDARASFDLCNCLPAPVGVGGFAVVELLFACVVF